jgi:hypothetical protein
MFERFTETARRVIFFARYEASNFGSPVIDTHHVLLGALREDKTILRPYLGETVRRQIENKVTRGAKISTSVDLPLSRDAKRALAFAAEEAKMLRHEQIDTGHLVLGLLRVETSLAAEMLRENGISLETMRGLVGKNPPVRPIHAPPDPEIAPAAASLKPAIDKLDGLVNGAEARLCMFSDADTHRALAKKPWSRKEALGHLLDWATTHHQWFACALTTPKLVAAGYPGEDWARSQNYTSFAWEHLVRLWVSINLLLVHVLSGVPETKLNTPCRIGIDPPMPLSELIAGYVEHCEEILAQILTRG